MALTCEQQRFLSRYVNSKGDFYGVLATMGLEVSHIIMWQNTSKEFDENFRNTKRMVLQLLKEENYMIAVRKVNDALINGVYHQSVIEKHRINANGESEFENIKTKKFIGVPAWAIQEALKESSIIKAVNTLASEGVLPMDVARKIIHSANKISDEIISAFNISSEEENITDKKAIALIKQAILGVTDA